VTYIISSEAAKIWNAVDGVYLVGWMHYQIFIAIGLLQLLNLYWYYLMMRILVRLVTQVVKSLFQSLRKRRAILTSKMEDERSDDEDDGEDNLKEQ
jgi:acyl-CoA-dependent ceramide synthase